MVGSPVNLDCLIAVGHVWSHPASKRTNRRAILEWPRYCPVLPYIILYYSIVYCNIYI